MYDMSTYIKQLVLLIKLRNATYEGWNFNSDNYLFTTDTK